MWCEEIDHVWFRELFVLHTHMCVTLTIEWLGNYLRLYFRGFFTSLALATIPALQPSAVVVISTFSSAFFASFLTHWCRGITITITTFIPAILAGYIIVVVTARITSFFTIRATTRTSSSVALFRVAHEENKSQQSKQDPACCNRR